MNKSFVNVSLQISVVILSAVLLLLGAALWTRSERTDYLARIDQAAVNTLLDGDSVRKETALDGGDFTRIFVLSDGGSILEYRGKTGYSELHMLIRLTASHSYVSHDIISINNPVNGWEFGNSFAQRELPAVTPGSGSVSGIPTRLYPWNDLLSRIIRRAEEYRQ